jgi:hypothetical protein
MGPPVLEVGQLQVNGVSPSGAPASTHDNVHLIGHRVDRYGTCQRGSAYQGGICPENGLIARAQGRASCMTSASSARSGSTMAGDAVVEQNRRHIRIEGWRSGWTQVLMPAFAATAAASMRPRRTSRTDFGGSFCTTVLAPRAGSVKEFCPVLR